MVPVCFIGPAVNRPQICSHCRQQRRFHLVLKAVDASEQIPARVLISERTWFSVDLLLLLPSASACCGSVVNKSIVLFDDSWLKTWMWARTDTHGDFQVAWSHFHNVPLIFCKIWMRITINIYIWELLIVTGWRRFTIKQQLSNMVVVVWWCGASLQLQNLEQMDPWMVLSNRKQVQKVPHRVMSSVLRTCGFCHDHSSRFVSKWVRIYLLFNWNPIIFMVPSSHFQLIVYLEIYVFGSFRRFLFDCQALTWWKWMFPSW